MTMYGGASRWDTPLANWRQLHLAGTGPGAPVVPANRRLDCISVVAGVALATIDALGLPTITVPPGMACEYDLDGGELAPGGGITVTIGGAASSWVVTYSEAP